MSISSRKSNRTAWSNPRPPAPNTAYICSIIDEGAKADGISDDSAAFRTALDKVGQQGGGIVQIPDRRVVITLNTPASGAVFYPAEDVIIRGDGPNAELIIKNANPANWNALFKVDNPGFHIESLKITRGTDFSGSFIVMSAATNMWLYKAVLDGKRDDYSNGWHALMLDGMQPATIDGITLSHTTIRGNDFGLLQDSSKTVTVQNITIDRCLFENNYATDLEFNAPNSLMKQIQVKRSVFRHNKSTGSSAGWGVGFANVQYGTIIGNSFFDYAMNAIHIEDRSAHLQVQANTFMQCSATETSYDADIFIISGANNITVTKNTFDTRQQQNTIDCVYIGDGGSSMQPHDISVTDNTAYLAHGSSIIVTYNAYNIISSPNTLL